MNPDNAMLVLVKQTAQRHGLDPRLVCAVIEQESSWNTYAMRYEPAFCSQYVIKIPGLTPTQQVARSISWGLMQVMGQTAWELGYRGDFPALCVPLNGIEFGCRKLAPEIAKANGDLQRALRSYNGGANPNYAGDVLARMKRYESV